MCFVTTKSAKAKIAKEDIVCWKVLNSDFSPIYGFQYVLHTHPYLKGVVNSRVIIKKEQDIFFDFGVPSMYVINEGYHSYKSESIAEGECPMLMFFLPAAGFPIGDIKVVMFLIPKGTKYYENQKEYVSETIIML